MPADSLALLMEVADTTCSYDLGTKARIYAGAAVPEYWVADVGGEVIHQLWSPMGDAYAKRRLVPFGKVIVAATIEALNVETGAL